MNGRLARAMGGAGLALLAAGAGTAATPDTPRAIYRRDVTCAGGALAASQRAGPTADAEAKAKAAELASLTLQDAQTAGAKVGLTRQQVGHDVQAQRDGVMTGLSTTDRGRAEQESSDLGKLLIDCALVHAIAAK